MKLNKIFGQHKVWLTLTTVMAIFLLLPVFAANAEALSNYVGKFIFYILFAPFVALFELEMIILPIIAQFNNFTKLPGIVDGWVILRDLSNMFFIVVLLFMAFATILKFQSYGYKELLKTLIIMAILINFSKTIAGLLIDIGQVVMLTFVAAIKDVAAGNLTSIFGVDNMVTIGTKNGETISAEGSQIVLAYLLGGVMMMLASIVVMAFIVMLVMRIVFLWVLVVLSPLAFLANTFPATKKYFSEWLGSLTKEIIVGPVLIFFLWLSLSILNSSGNGQDITSEFKATSNGRQQQEQNDNESFIGNDASIGFTEAGKWDNVLKFIIAISMLIGSLKVTQGMGSKAMAYGSQAADKLKSGASKAYKFAGNRAWKGSTGEGGLSGGLQRAGSAVAVPTLRAMGTEAFGMPLIGGVMTRASARLEGAEDQRKQRKQAKIEDRYKYIRDERKEAVYSSRGGNYSKRSLDKIEIEQGKLKEKSEEEKIDMANRARQLNDTATLTKLQNDSVMVNTEDDFDKAILAGKGVERFKAGWGGTYTEDPNGVVHAMKDENSVGFKQGMLAARKFSKMSLKDQEEAWKAMSKKDKDALIAYRTKIKPDYFKDLDTKNKEQVQIVERVEKTEEDGVDANGKKKYKTTKEDTPKPNADSAVVGNAAFMARHAGGTEAAMAAYSDLIEQMKVAEAALPAPANDVTRKPFDKDSFDKIVVKGMEAGDLLKMDINSKMYDNIAKHLTPAQMQAMSQEGGGAHIQKAVDNKIVDALIRFKKPGKEYQALSDIRKLLNNVLTKGYITDTQKRDITETTGLQMSKPGNQKNPATGPVQEPSAADNEEDDGEEETTN